MHNYIGGRQLHRCGHNYIDKTIRNAVTRIDQHEQPNGKS